MNAMGWLTYILLIIVLFSIFIVFFSINNLRELSSLRDQTYKNNFLYVLCVSLCLIFLYFLYHFTTNQFEPLHILISLSAFIAALLTLYISKLSKSITVDLVKVAAVEHYHATHDDLTGLPNLNYFNDQLDLILKDASEKEYDTALMLIDLKRFKLINETIGYFAGDMMLQEIAKRIRESLRKTDLIARVGGDEFAVLINPVVAHGHIHTISKNIAESIQEPLAVEGKPTDVGVSIGVSVYPKHANNALELIDKARISMIEAEKRGDSVLIYDPDTTLGTAEDIQIIGMLQRAIQEEQLTILYQPQVCLHNMKLASVEALIRWQHPKYGRLDPQHFIPYAERAGLIYEINLWLLKNVVRLIREWRDKDIHLPIAINITANGFLNKDFQQELNSITKNDSWLGNQLKIELTETSTIDNAIELIPVIKKYKKLGLAFSLDDYGTKRASLEYLKKLPLDELKIDQSFMMNATTDEDSRAIILHAKEIAQQLGLVTTAEGIESKEVLILAQEFNLDYGQGYYFSPALPPKDLARHIKEHGLDAGVFTNINK